MRLQGIWRKRQNEKNAPCLKDRRFQGCFNGREEWKVFGFIVILRAMVILLITSILVFLAVRLITRDGKHVNLEFALGPAYVGFALALFMLLMKKRVFVPRHFKNNHGQTVGCHKHVFAGDILHSVHVDRMAEGLPFSNQFSFADYFDYGIGLCGASVIAKNFKKISFVH